MKKLCLLFVLSILTLSNCGRIEPEESILVGELPSFEYLGYTYYIHPSLAVYDGLSSDDVYKDHEKEVESLDSYGFQSWFIPSINELRYAASLGIVRKGIYYLSSTKDGRYYQGYGTGDDYDHYHQTSLSSWSRYTILPMIKFRNSN